MCEGGGWKDRHPPAPFLYPRTGLLLDARYLPALSATYCATASLSAPVSRPAGMPPPPFSIWLATVALSGFRSSRFGPTEPLVPASLMVWQPPHVLAKSDFPLELLEPPPPPPVSDFV